MQIYNFSVVSMRNNKLKVHKVILVFLFFWRYHKGRALHYIFLQKSKKDAVSIANAVVIIQKQEVRI